jgi:hypothetical protein
MGQGTHALCGGSQVKGIAAHCPTRWGSLVYILRDLLASKVAIKAMCMDDSWNEVGVACCAFYGLHAKG